MWKTLRYLWENEDGFFGIGDAPTSEEKGLLRGATSAAKFGIGEGEGDIKLADNFWKSILSGDPSKIASVLGPQTSAINKEGQQEKKTLSEFGNRSGGTNARAQGIDDKTRSSYQDMVSSLTGGAASALGSSGSSLFGQGVGANAEAFSEANVVQGQHSKQLNDIFKSIADIAGGFLAPGA